MSRIQLQIYMNPGQAEVVVNVQRTDQTYERLMAIVDTGAEISLLPKLLMDKLTYRLGTRGSFVIEQAGIAKQAFEAVEAYITIFLEDRVGNSTKPFEISVWFADTRTALIGFAGLLDRAVLHIDMLRERSGWIEIDS
jgi:hypothetical protein